jgi:hypothetical protein
MKYQIYVRQVEEKDLSFDCPFPDYDEDTYNMHLGSLVEDISSNTNIVDATESNNIITIETSLDEKDLLDTLKDLFKSEFCFVKFKEIKAVA